MERVPITMGKLILSPKKDIARIIAKRGDKANIGVALVTPIYLILA
jgi:hypothetical protein